MWGQIVFKNILSTLNLIIMKTSIFTFVLLITLFVLYSCGSKSETKTLILAQEETPMFKPQDTISLVQFARRINRWSQKGKMYLDTSMIRYFDMKKIDLTQLLGENATNARFYMGLDSVSSGYRAHLLLVGTDANGNNLTGPGHHVYNYTVVCPPACTGVNK
jgi:hypothetical protein